MPKAILEFNLPDEQYEFDCANNGANWKRVVEELNKFLRDKIKYQNEFKSGKEELEGVNDLLYSTLSDFGLSIFD